MQSRKLTLNGLIALSLLGLCWLVILLGRPSTTTLGGMLLLSVVAGVMAALTR